MLVETIDDINEIVAPAIANNKKIGNLEDAIKCNYFNCWGFVSRLFGWTPTLVWVPQYTMNDYLRNKTYSVDNPQPGDIAVWRYSDDDLTHTALVLDATDDLIIIHKPGSFDLEYGSCENDDLTLFGGSITYRRVK